MTYIDDTQHIIVSKTTEGLNRYIQDMHDAIIQIYRHKSLQLNGNKKEIISFSKYHKEDRHLINIRDNNGNIITEKNTIKVLEYIMNQKNDLDNHLSALFGKISRTHNNIRVALSYLCGKNKKITLESKLRGQFDLTLLLPINQNQRIQYKAKVFLMRINKWIYGKSVFKLENKKNCKFILNIVWEHKILNASAKFIHKLMKSEEQISVKDYIGRP